MESTTRTKTASARGLEIQLNMATEYRRFAKRALPNTGEVVATTMHIIELGWALEDAKRIAR